MRDTFTQSAWRWPACPQMEHLIDMSFDPKYREELVPNDRLLLLSFTLQIRMSRPWNDLLLSDEIASETSVAVDKVAEP